MPEDEYEWFTKHGNSISRLFAELERIMSESITEGMVRERQLPNGGRIKEFGPFTYGYSMRIGPDGQPEIEEFGNLRPPRSPKPLQPIKPFDPFSKDEAPIEREPMVDIFTKNNEVKVIVEIPNAQESEITLQCIGRSLVVSVKDEKWKEIQLPTNVDPRNHKHTFKNGILEVTLQKLALGNQGDNESKIRWI
jgi:HSP20 family protein